MTPSMRSSTRLVVAAAATVALAVPLAALAMARDENARAGVPSFTRDVAPVIAEKCAGCHRPGGIAPFSLMTAKQISQSSAAIAAAVETRLMPPWPRWRPSSARSASPS